MKTIKTQKTNKEDINFKTKLRVAPNPSSCTATTCHLKLPPIKILAHSRDLPHTLLVPPPPLCCSEAPPPVLPLPCAADRPSYMTARAHKQVCGITLSPCGWSTPANIFSYRAFALRRTSSFIEATCMCTTDTPTTHRPVRTVTDAPVH